MSSAAATMGQRISRAKAQLRDTGLDRAGRGDLPRLAVALHVLYLIFNEGYATTSGPDLQRSDLSTEAIRLTRSVPVQSTPSRPTEIG